jgi:integrase
MKVALRDRKIPSGKRTLYLDIYHKGKRRLEYLGIYLDGDREKNRERKRLAEKIRTEREIELQNLNYNFIPDYKKRQNFITYFESIAEEDKNSTATKNTLVKLKEFSGNILSFQEIDEKWLGDFKKFLLKKVSRNSASTYFQKVKQVLKRAKVEKIISVNPGEFVSNIRMVQTQRVFLEMKELQKLGKTECRNGEVKRAFLFACWTGLRFSDIKKLTWNEIKNNQIQLKQTKTKNFTYIPLAPTALQLLKKEVNVINLETSLVFNLPQKWWTNQILKEWCKNAKIKKDISFHTSRHTFATMSLTYGVDLYTVSSLLDHQNIKTTQVYAKIIDKKKEDAVKSLPEILIS